jgi:hypothetical protein
LSIHVFSSDHLPLRADWELNCTGAEVAVPAKIKPTKRYQADEKETRITRG